MDFSSANITQPTTDSFHLDAILAITNGGSTDATLTYVTPVVVAFNGNQLFNLTVQPVDLKAGSGQVGVSQTVNIYNATAWEAFNKDLLAASSLNLEFKATLSVSAVGQTFNNLNLDKTVAVQGRCHQRLLLHLFYLSFLAVVLYRVRLISY